MNKFNNKLLQSALFTINNNYKNKLLSSLNSNQSLFIRSYFGKYNTILRTTNIINKYYRLNSNIQLLSKTEMSCNNIVTAASPTEVNSGNTSTSDNDSTISTSNSMSNNISEQKIVNPNDLTTLTTAYRIIDTDCNDDRKSPLLLTCEHASVLLPHGMQWSDNDQINFAGLHWSYDPGSSDFLMEWTREISTIGILATVSRLYIDVNRAIGSDTMFRTIGDNKLIEINQNLSDADKNKRIDTYYWPYHNKLHELFKLRKPKLVLSIHSFTPVYEGKPRTVEVGILYNRPKDEKLANSFKSALNAAGIITEINEPWSGFGGLMFTADYLVSQSIKNKIIESDDSVNTIMLEFRQDLVSSPIWRSNVRQILQQVIKEAGFYD